MSQEVVSGGPPPAGDVRAVAEPAPGRSVARALPEESRPAASAARLPSLTGLRFPAALLVFLNHSGLPFPVLRLLGDDGAAKNWLDVTRYTGALGVTFFFVLSGFVLTWSARPADTPRAFLRRRLVKIYPLYLITWALAMWLVASATPARTAIANLFMLHVWVPRFDVFTSVDVPSWSLGCEALFYASFPLLYALFRRIRPERLLYWIAGTTAAIVLTPLVAYAALPGTPVFPPGPLLGANVSAVQEWFVYFLPPVRMLDFALGMLVALAVRNGRWRDIGMVWSALLLAGAYLLSTQVPFLYAQRSMTMIPIVLLIAAAATADVRGRFSLFRTRTMIWLGEISFAFYLVHYIVLAYGRKVLGTTVYSTTATAFLLTAMCALSVLLAWALYTLVERPLTRHFSSPRRPRGPVPSPHATV